MNSISNNKDKNDDDGGIEETAAAEAEDIEQKNGHEH